MHFVNRQDELERLDRLMQRERGGLAVLYGRRRVGKTRLLVEWVARHRGLYTVADQSSAKIQRGYLAQAIGERFEGFSEVEYPDWPSLLSRLAREARAYGWRGPVALDELPYLAVSTPELPSQLQRWIDHEAREANLVVAVSGSAQRMMQGIVLGKDAPLYGRADEIFEVAPLAPSCLAEVFGPLGVPALVECWAAWGGVPRYWELAVEVKGPTVQRVDRLALDPMGPLHREPDRLLIEETPAAIELRPVLDAIGMGASRLSEIAGRMGRQATSLSRPLSRLVEMGLLRREVPFGEEEKKSRRSLYRVEDSFFRLWFRVVAPNQAKLLTSNTEARRALFARHWPGLVSLAWEDLCRRLLPRIEVGSPLGDLGPWGPAQRWWRRDLPEWDAVAETACGGMLLFGEAKWASKPVDERTVRRAAARLSARQAPALPARYQDRPSVRALFFPEVKRDVPRLVEDVLVVTGSDLLV